MGSALTLDEAETRTRLIDPALHARGWTEDLIKREETLGTVEIVDGRPKRALLSLATGSGKTFIAVNVLRKIADAGQLRRALFACDRDELRRQGLLHFQNAFGNDAAASTGAEPQKNARIIIATYQILDIDRDDADARFLFANYPEDYFSHVVIDECHRSAWGKWSIVLARNPKAGQIGLTATPRQLDYPRTRAALLRREHQRRQRAPFRRARL